MIVTVSFEHKMVIGLHQADDLVCLALIVHYPGFIARPTIEGSQ